MNSNIIDQFKNLIFQLKLEDDNKNIFKIKSFEKAVSILSNYPSEINNSDELKGIYKICRPKASERLVNSTIANLVHHSGASFNQKRGRLNKKIIQLLKEPRFKHYIIDGQRNDRYFINISSDLVDIRF